MWSKKTDDVKRKATELFSPSFPPPSALDETRLDNNENDRALHIAN